VDAAQPERLHGQELPDGLPAGESFPGAQRPLHGLGHAVGVPEASQCPGFAGHRQSDRLRAASGVALAVAGQVEGVVVAAGVVGHEALQAPNPGHEVPVGGGLGHGEGLREVGVCQRAVPEVEGQVAEDS